ncbi:MAG: hypothetical protein WB611_21215 [Stellaceae bacterium]
MKRPSFFCFVRLPLTSFSLWVLLDTFAADAHATFLYAISEKVTGPPAGNGTADDFDLVVDTGTPAAGRAPNEAPNIAGTVPGANIKKAPFMSLLTMNATGKPTQ